MKTNLWRDIPIVLVAVGLLDLLFLPVFAGDGIQAPPTICLSNVKRSSLGLIMYASDENDHFPMRDSWIDATFPYVKSEAVWHCPSVSKRSYGYAFNGALSRAKQTLLDNPATTPVVYESVNPIRNASDLCASLPLPGRHGRQDGQGSSRNTVGYADGHAKAVPGTPAG